MTDQTSKDVTPDDIRDVVGWLAVNATGMSLEDWGPRANTLLKAATAIEQMRADWATICQASEAMPTSEMAAVSEVMRLRAALHKNDRWNIETTATGFRVCRGDHHRSSDCEWEEYVPRGAGETGGKS